MTDIICPLCGKPNPPELDECKYCQAPLKTGGFLPPEQGEEEQNPPPLSFGETGEPESSPETPESAPSLEDAVPDWLKETEAGFLEKSEPEVEPEPEEPTPDQLSEQLEAILNPPSPAPAEPTPAIDDEWLTSLLAEASANEPPQPGQVEEQPQETIQQETTAGAEETIEEEQPLSLEPIEKPEWLTDMEATATFKLEGGIHEGQPEHMEIKPEEAEEQKAEELPAAPEWLTTNLPEETSAAPEWPTTSVPEETPEAPEWPTTSVSEETPPSTKEAETPIAPAELPGWLEAIRPPEVPAPTAPVEDVSREEIVTSGPLAGLQGVISPHPSAIRAQKPPTYSIKLRVTDEQRKRVEMMEELLANEDKPKPLPTKPIITSRHIIRLIIALVLLLPILWVIIAGSRQTSTPQPSNIPGLADFTQQIKNIPSGAPVLVAFDYEAGFSGEMNLAINNVVAELENKNAFLAFVSTTSAGPALAASLINQTNPSASGVQAAYANYANLGYIPGGVMGLSGLATSSLRELLPFSLEGGNVWAAVPLNSITAVKDFSAVIIITNDPDTARIWIEQVGSQLQAAETPLLIVTSSQAEPLIRPYYEASPPQVQGLVSGLVGGVAYARAVGASPQNGVLDAFSLGVTISVLVILVGSIAGVVLKMAESNKKEESQ